MRKTKKAELGRKKREFLVRLPERRYEALSQFASESGASLSFVVNEAIASLLTKARLETNGR